MENKFKVVDDSVIISKTLANSLIGSKENLYRIACEMGFYLPDIKSCAINCEYLLNVVNDKVFRIPIEKVRPYKYEYKKWSKIDIASVMPCYCVE